MVTSNRRIALLWSLLLGVVPSAVAQSSEKGPQQQRHGPQLETPVLSNAFPLSNILVDESNVVAYDRTRKQLVHLRFSGNEARVEHVFDLQPTDSDRSPGEGRLSIWDLDAQRDAAGDILVTWRHELPSTQSIRVLSLKSDGTIVPYVVKEFPKFDSFFALRAFVIDAVSLQFFYTSYSEKYFSPIADVGSIEKLWTLGWRERKTVFDLQLSEKGRIHTTRYDVFYRGSEAFDIAWTEQRIGSLLGPGRTFKIGMILNDKGKPKLTEVASVPIDEWVKKGQMVAPIVVRSRKGDLEGIAEIASGKSGTVYKQIDSAGMVRDALTVRDGEAGQFAFDAHTGLFRYVAGALTGFLKPPRSIKAEVHWGDFEGHQWTQGLEIPGNGIFLNQRAGECFYWLEPNAKGLELRKKCRR